MSRTTESEHRQQASDRRHAAFEPTSSIAAAVVIKDAEAFDHRLRIVRPILPGFVRGLELERLRVGDAVVDLRFERTSDGRVTVEVGRVKGHLDVVIESVGIAPTQTNLT